MVTFHWNFCFILALAVSMGNSCSSNPDFFQIKRNINGTDTYQPWSATFKANTVLGVAFDIAWPLSIALLGLNIVDWVCRAAAARVRKDARSPLTPAIAQFLGHGNRIRQLCAGLYGFLWVYFFVIISDPLGGGDLNAESSRRVDSAYVLDYIRFFFRKIPWASA